MGIEQAIEILERHNRWRRGDDEMPETNPKQLGEAIDTIIKYYKKQKHEKAAKQLKPRTIKDKR